MSIKEVRRRLAFLILPSKDQCRVDTLFSNLHLFFSTDSNQRREFVALKNDFEW